MSFRRLAVLAVALSSLTAAIGCGGVDSTVACDFRSGGLNGVEPRCQEWINSLAATTFEQTCNTAKGKYINGQCPRDGIVAGCEQKTGNADGSRTIDWYYSPETETSIKAGCTSPDTFQPKP